MKICVPAVGSELTSAVDSRFGRCRYLHFIDLETRERTCRENVERNGEHGVGIQVAQQIMEEDVWVVICSQIGPNAIEVLTSGGIAVYEGDKCSVEEAIARFRENRLRRLEE